MFAFWSLFACNTPQPSEVPPLPKALQPTEEKVETKTEPVPKPQPKQTTSKKSQTPTPSKVDSGMIGDKLFFSEVMVNPSKVVKFRGEWIELYNPTDTTINLATYTIHSKENEKITFTDKDKVEPKSTFLLAVRKSPSGNGGLPEIDFLYTKDDLIVTMTDLLELKNGDTLVDSWELTREDFKKGYALQRNANGKFCKATQTYGDGDFGTPGQAIGCPE